MIRVALADEPDDFDQKVRKPGLRAIAELVGEVPEVRRRGRPTRKRAERREDLKSDDFPPLWTDALDDLCSAYHRICAYTSFYIPRVTGARSVDHMIPKSVAWDHVYEWSNLRLACAIMNSRKRDAQTVLDPFEVLDEWFELDCVGYQVKPRDGVEPDILARVEDTLIRMGLNDGECCALREEYVSDYRSGDISLTRLERRAPFIARELRRQGKLRAGDV